MKKWEEKFYLKMKINKKKNRKIEKKKKIKKSLFTLQEKNKLK